jgi:hypothetical protein
LHDGPLGLIVVAVGVRQQRQEAGLLDSGGQLTLIACLGAGDTAGHDLAGFGDVGFQGVQILEIKELDTFRGKAAELATAIKTGHG